jgi:hypothetical protein
MFLNGELPHNSTSPPPLPLQVNWSRLGPGAFVSLTGPCMRRRLAAASSCPRLHDEDADGMRAVLCASPRLEVQTQLA